MNNSINLPIEARSIFRILAIRKIVERPEFAAQLGKQFEDFLSKVPFSGRISNEDKYPDFLNYSTQHNGDNCNTDIDKMSEEQMCKSSKCFFTTLTCKTLNENGECNNNRKSTICIIDYQVPLNSSRDIGEGVIDMIGADIGADGNKIYIIEAKKWDSNEHPLRAMFEAITFWKMVQNGKDNGTEFIRRYILSLSDSRQNRKNKDEILQDESLNNQDKSLNEKVKNVLGEEVKKVLKEKTEKPSKEPQSNIRLIPVILIRKNSKIYEKIMDGSLDPNYRQVYKKILDTTPLRYWCYSKVAGEESKVSEVMIEDFTAAFLKQLQSNKH